MKKVLPLLTSTAYFPPAHWFAAAHQLGDWRIEAHENYQKGGWRNRCRIVGPNGILDLSVPLEKGKHQKKPVREVTISYRNDWWREHEQSIRTAYGRSPYYEFYAEEIFSVARQRPATIWELNEALISKISQLLQLKVPPTSTSDFVFPKDEGFYRPEDLPSSLLPYPQVFSDRFEFTAGLSVLDSLFCLGPQAKLNLEKLLNE